MLCLNKIPGTSSVKCAYGKVPLSLCPQMMIVQKETTVDFFKRSTVVS